MNTTGSSSLVRGEADRVRNPMPGPPASAPVLSQIRIVSDSRPGHENQSVGLAAGLARRTGAAVETVRFGASARLLERRRAATTLVASKAPPQLVIGAGHATHLPLWFAARRFGARTVVVMKPSWPTWLFDLCLVPGHDLVLPWSSHRVIRTRGALNRIPEVTPPKQPRGVVLLGGPSKHHAWMPAPLHQAVAAVLTARPDLTWTVADSRRTPDGFLEELRHRNLPANLVSHTRTTPEWLPDQLAAAEEVWVTEDSISMIFEAATAGARVGLLPAPALKSGDRLLRSVAGLVADGYTTTFATWQRNGGRLPAPKRLHETARCADLVLARLFPSLSRSP